MATLHPFPDNLYLFFSKVLYVSPDAPSRRDIGIRMTSLIVQSE